MSSGLKRIAEKLENVVGDLSSLEVTTFTGDITAIITPTKVPTGKVVDNKEQEVDANKIQWDSFMDIAKGTTVDAKEIDTTLKGSISLALATHIAIDGDAKHFVRDTNVSEYLIKTHAEAVKAGSEYRTQIITFLASRVAGVLG